MLQAGLLIELVRLDIHTRYFSSWWGAWLLVLHPLILLVAYTWFFGDLLQLRNDSTQHQFSEYLLAGLIAFNGFTEVVTRSPTLLAERRELLLNTPLSIHLIPWIPVLSSLVAEGCGVLLLSLWLVWQGEGHCLAGLYYLPWLMIRLLWSSAASHFFSILGLLITDLRHLIPPLLSLLLLVSPVFYRLEQIPVVWQSVLYANPLTTLVQGYQQALVNAQFNLQVWLITLLLSSVVWAICVPMSARILARVRVLL